MGMDALTWIRMAWGGMLKRGAVNCWEEWDDNASLCHAWGASPAYFMSSEILGVKHEQLWNGVLVIKPDLMGLEWAAGVVAVGNDSEAAVKISLEWDGICTNVAIEAPPELSISLDLSKLRNPKLRESSKLQKGE